MVRAERQPQGPHLPAHVRARRGARRAQAGHARAGVLHRQRGHRVRVRRRGEGLPLHDRHAGGHERRAQEDHARLRRRARLHARAARATSTSRSSACDEIRAPIPRGYWVPGPVRQPGQRRGPLPHHRARGLGADGRRHRRLRGLAGQRRHAHRRRPLSCASATRACGSTRSSPTSARCWRAAQWGPHGIEGIGDGFIPDNLDVSLLSGVITTTTEESLVMARRLAAEEGIFCGISTGCNVAAALKLAAPPSRAAVDRDHGQRHRPALLHDRALRRGQARGRARARAPAWTPRRAASSTATRRLGDPGLNPAEYDFVAARRRLEAKAEVGRREAHQRSRTPSRACATATTSPSAAASSRARRMALVREILRRAPARASRSRATSCAPRAS